MSAGEPGELGEEVLALAALDEALDRLAHELAGLPARRALEALDAELEACRRRQAGLAAERDRLAGEQAALEAQAEAARVRRDQLEARARSGQIRAARDLAAIDEEMQQLARHVAGLEDQELALMEALEPLEAELAGLAAELADLEERRAGRAAELAAAEREVEAQQVALLPEREARARALPDEVLARYEAIRRRVGGPGAARLVGGRCEGCHLTLPAMEVDRLRRAPGGTLGTCEQCGRILVPVH
ncbi:zinc ribbon domain-containing protein [Aciditerrimonas ferrireducens]|uniref:zinc ribbon domain-containing protein n=1 Tax=Aciditerrimonas ferrireducens TaxID=667306 RepID=UPI00249DCC46|nr:C4-type zinc ribbon domain-containing protein [Aciditerrimonas ferrireducens]